MDVPAKAVLVAQDAQRLDHELGRVIRAFYDAGAYEQPFDIVASVERYRQVGQLARGERGARDFVACTIHAVGAVIDADVGHEHLQKRDAAPIGCEAVAAPCGHCVSQLAAPSPSVHTGGCAGHIVLCGVGEDFQLFDDIHGYTCSFEYLFVF